MNHQLRKLLTLIVLLGLSGFLSTSLYAAESARVEVILVEASNSEGGVDSSLKQYSGTLQRLFRFKSYKQVSKGNLKLSVPGEGSVGLAGGQRLSLKADEGSSRGLMAELSWTRGNKRLLHTKIQLRPGNPAVMGGPSTGKGGNYLLILTMK